MKNLEELHFRIDLPKELHSDFFDQINRESIDRLQVTAWLAFIFHVLFLFLDHQRKVDGRFYEFDIYSYYQIVHFVGLGFLIPAVVITAWKRRIVSVPRYRSAVIYSMMLLIFVALFSNVTLAYFEKGSLILYVCYIFLSNWAYPFKHVPRMIFNLVSIAIILCVVLFPFPEFARFEQGALPAQRLVSVYEVLGITALAFIFDTFDFNLRVIKFKNEKQLEVEKRRIEELEQMKSRLYTNITHEFRTPLTVISGMTEQITGDSKTWLSKGTEMIRRNSRRLLRLVDQLLSLSKLEAGNMTITLVHGDVLPYLRYIVDSFKTFAKSKEISVHFLSDEVELNMDYDPEKTLDILSNLLSNAIKYTPRGGDIYVRLDRLDHAGDDIIQLRIKDTGVGIAEKQLPLIFDRFYQVDRPATRGGHGTGIGLSIVKELTELMDGTINVKSTVGEGTEFTLKFPIRNDISSSSVEFRQSSVHELAATYFQPEPSDEQWPTLLRPKLEEVPQVLLIEDNADVVDYIRSCLVPDYSVLCAMGGEAGIAMANDLVPDLVVSDVMMPVVDGYEVCRALKTGTATSHIPVILLTAKADDDSKMLGLQVGADEYIIKPFDPEELRVRLRNMMHLRQAMQERYAAELPKDPDGTPNVEDAFVRRVNKAILDHLDDVDFNTMRLCRAVGLSRTQLHNKLKALTGKSASLYVRFVRLQKGYELLQQGVLNVSEVAYDVGFRDPNYFTRTFTAQFGMSPSKVRGNQ